MRDSLVPTKMRCEVVALPCAPGITRPAHQHPEVLCCSRSSQACGPLAAAGLAADVRDSSALQSSSRQAVFCSAEPEVVPDTCTPHCFKTREISKRRSPCCSPGCPGCRVGEAVVAGSATRGQLTKCFVILLSL